MTYLTLNITSILLSEFLLIYFILRTEKKHIPDNEIKPLFVLGANYSEYFWMPLGFQLAGSLFIEIITNHTASPYLKAIPPFLITTIGTLLLISTRYKRFYFTNNGLIIYNLFSNKKDIILLDKIKEAGKKRTLRSTLFFIQITGKTIYFTRNQLGNETQFKEYFIQKEINWFDEHL